MNQALFMCQALCEAILVDSLNFTITLWDNYYYYPHFTEEKN